MTLPLDTAARRALIEKIGGYTDAQTALDKAKSTVRALASNPDPGDSESTVKMLTDTIGDSLKKMMEFGCAIHQFSLEAKFRTNTESLTMVPKDFSLEND